MVTTLPSNVASCVSEKSEHHLQNINKKINLFRCTLKKSYKKQVSCNEIEYYIELNILNWAHASLCHNKYNNGYSFYCF